MNAVDQAHSFACVQALASVVTLVKSHFPEVSPSFAPWRDDLQTRRWSERETLDLAFYFPGWSPRLQCRSVLVQLRVSEGCLEKNHPNLLGVVMRGMTYDGERWRLVTAGNWEPTGTHLPQPLQVAQLQEICRGLFKLFSA